MIAACIGCTVLINGWCLWMLMIAPGPVEHAAALTLGRPAA